jgi:hypothetical protein
MVHSTISEAERGNGNDFTLRTWSRLAAATGTTLQAYLEQASAADHPRDVAHLRVQELLLATAESGGWQGTPELALDDPARGSRFVDVALQRARAGTTEAAVLEVVDWVEDVGAGLRDWTRRLARAEQLAIARFTRDDVERRQPIVPRVSGCWVMRATNRNRRLVRDHPRVFRARFPGDGAAWLSALRGPVIMPGQPAVLWVSVDGKRLWAARLK